MLSFTTLITQKIYFPFDQQRDKHSLQYTLKWRQGQLLVNLYNQLPQPQLPPLRSERWLVECLKRSPVRLIRIDPDLGEAELRFWADACEQAKKPVFLRLPTAHALPRQQSQRSWWLKRLIDWSASAILLLVLSPAMLGLVLLIRIYLPGPIFVREWHVGKRGKLFRVFKFRTDAPRATPLGRWMRKYRLDELPQLFNVLRGEMSLVGSRPWTLCDAVRISAGKRQKLNALSGIVGTWQWKHSQTS